MTCSFSNVDVFATLSSFARKLQRTWCCSRSWNHWYGRRWRRRTTWYLGFEQMRWKQCSVLNTVICNVTRTISLPYPEITKGKSRRLMMKQILKSAWNMKVKRKNSVSGPPYSWKFAWSKYFETIVTIIFFFFIPWEFIAKVISFMMTSMMILLSPMAKLQKIQVLWHWSGCQIPLCKPISQPLLIFLLLQGDHGPQDAGDDEDASKAASVDAGGPSEEDWKNLFDRVKNLQEYCARCLALFLHQVVLLRTHHLLTWEFWSAFHHVDLLKKTTKERWILRMLQNHLGVPLKGWNGRSRADLTSITCLQTASWLSTVHPSFCVSKLLSSIELSVSKKNTVVLCSAHFH